jgi:hypothetical protein
VWLESLLTVRGKLINAVIKPCGTFYNCTLMDVTRQNELMDVLFLPDMHLESFELPTTNGQHQRSLRRSTANCQATRSQVEIENTEVHCLVLGHRNRKRVYGLILGISDTVPGAYTRLGLFRDSWSSPAKTWFQKRIEKTISIV